MTMERDKVGSVQPTSTHIELRLRPEGKESAFPRIGTPQDMGALRVSSLVNVHRAESKQSMSDDIIRSVSTFSALS